METTLIVLGSIMAYLAIGLFIVCPPTIGWMIGVEIRDNRRHHVIESSTSTRRTCAAFWPVPTLFWPIVLVTSSLIVVSKTLHRYMIKRATVSVEEEKLRSQERDRRIKELEKKDMIHG